MSTQDSFVTNDSIQDLFSTSEIIENNFNSDIDYEHLRVIFSEVLSTVSFVDVEDNIFKDEVPKLKSACTEVMNKLKETVQKSDSREDILGELKNLLQMYIDLLKLAHDALKYISNKVQFEQVQSLPLPVCEILLETFTHCKQSDTIYGDYFASLSELLTALFKKANEVQSSFLNLLNTILVFDLRKEHHVFVITEVSRLLSSMGEILTGLDIKTAAELWKVFIVFTQTYKDHLKSRLNIGPALKFLSSEVTDTIPTIINSTDMKQMEKLLKISNFNLKILIKLCGLFDDNLGDAYEKLFVMLITINRYTDSYLQLENRSSKYVDLMHAYVSVATEPFLNCVMGDRQFIHCYFTSIRSYFDNDSTRLSAIFLTISIIKKLISCKPDVQNLWLSIDPSLNIICVVFAVLDQCKKFMQRRVFTNQLLFINFIEGSHYRLQSTFLGQQKAIVHVEFSLDLVLDIPVHMAQPPRTASLYEYLLVHVCAMVVLLNERKIKVLHKTLVQSMVQSNSWKSIFAHDVWCVVGRYGSPEFCLNDVKFLLNLFHTLNKQTRLATVYLSSVMSRLYSTLGDNHKRQIAQEYPLIEYPKLWAHLGPNGSFHQQNIDDILMVASQKIETFLNNKPNCDNFNNTCEILDLISRYSKPEINPALAKGLAGGICKLWDLNLDTQHSNSLWFLRFIRILCKVTAFLMEYFINEELLKILRIVTELIKLNTRIKLSTCLILNALTTRVIEDSPEQKNIFDCIASLFNALLKDNNPLVKQAALEAFDYFAHNTSHETILPAIVAGDAKLQEEISEFLQKITHDFTSKQQYLHAQRSVAVKHVCYESNTCLEPQEKKKKLSNDINIDVIVQRMKHDCDSLVEYSTNGGETENISADISSIIYKLQSVFKK